MKYRILFLLLLVTSCSKHPSLPTSFTEVNETPHIYPDYVDVVVPPNIAPLNFLVDDVEDVVAEFQVQNSKLNFGGSDNKVQIDEKEWHELLAEAKGKSLSVRVYTKKDGKWLAYKPFSIDVAEEDIDPYVSFRVLPPTFVGYDELSIRQRNLTNFEETTIYNNRQISHGLEGQCINCHSYQNYGTSNMMFHTRMQNPGTMIVSDGELIFVNLKTDGMISAAAYNSWHPHLPIIAFSTDHTMQSFHTRDITKVEVMESASDLVIYDVKKNRVQVVLNDSTEWELQYNLYRLSFDADSMAVGEPELIYDARSKNRSAVQPRVSQDGRYVLLAEGPNGLFHIWHTSAEIEILDLQTGELLDTKAMNSPLPESYPSFSSNDRWIMFESRRDDGNYTRTYFAYFDKQGKVYKPFMMPAEDPEYFRLLLRSWSRPELMKEPVRITPRQFYEKILTEPLKVSN